MKKIYLEDLVNLTEAEVKSHIADNYAGTASGFDYGDPSKADMKSVEETLKGYNVVVAYESVGSWGCDSSSYFLLRKKKTREYFEFSGSHCSCYGFEGQFDLQEAPLAYLKSDKFMFYTGGYEDSASSNVEAVTEFVGKLK